MSLIKLAVPIALTVCLSACTRITTVSLLEEGSDQGPMDGQEEVTVLLRNGAQFQFWDTHTTPTELAGHLQDGSQIGLPYEDIAQVTVRKKSFFIGVGNTFVFLGKAVLSAVVITGAALLFWYDLQNPDQAEYADCP